MRFFCSGVDCDVDICAECVTAQPASVPPRGEAVGTAAQGVTGCSSAKCRARTTEWHAATARAVRASAQARGATRVAVGVTTRSVPPVRWMRRARGAQSLRGRQARQAGCTPKRGSGAVRVQRRGEDAGPYVYRYQCRYSIRKRKAWLVHFPNQLWLASPLRSANP